MLDYILYHSINNPVGYVSNHAIWLVENTRGCDGYQSIHHALEWHRIESEIWWANLFCDRVCISNVISQKNLAQVLKDEEIDNPGFMKKMLLKYYYCCTIFWLWKSQLLTDLRDVNLTDN